MTSTRSQVEAEIAARGGILQLDPAWVARSWLPAGRRLGLPDQDVEVGERGAICERWLASTTRASNLVGPDDEGLSRVRTEGGTLGLADAVAAAPEAIMGVAYARTHETLGRLAKIFDYGARIPFHIHPPAEQARRAGRNSKDEAYWFPPGVHQGEHPESFLGLHPGAGREEAGPAILEELRRWDGDEILRFSPAYRQIPRDGFFIPSGVLHAPGTALTIELQEESDSMAMFQALNAGRIIEKELLFKDLCAHDRERGEVALLDWVDWEENTDPWFFENHHTPPRPFRTTPAAQESWIFYGCEKFSGKQLTVAPGGADDAAENGVYSVLVWQGTGTIGGVPVRGGRPGADELLVVHDRAVQPLEVLNTGDQELVLVKIFGPDLNPQAPRIERTSR
jgi:hypothetical protein